MFVFIQMYVFFAYNSNFYTVHFELARNTELDWQLKLEFVLYLNKPE
jgi:hypothetical protein